MWQNEKSNRASDSSVTTGPWHMPLTKFNLVVTNLEHDTNVSPFVRMAEDIQVWYWNKILAAAK